MTPDRPSTIAVVGGGIAGTSAAWALHRAGHTVHLFEKGPALGGNAKTFRWALPDGGVAESPLLVVAWPEGHYHTYQRLLQELGLGATTLPIAYLATTPDGVIGRIEHLIKNVRGGTAAAD